MHVEVNAMYAMLEFWNSLKV